MKTGDLTLDPWQEEILKYDGNVLLCTGRQVGKTTIFAIKAAKYMMKHPKSQIIICSLTEDQAKLIIVMILDWLEKHEKKQIAKGKDKPTQSRITLINKAVVIARPVGTTGDSVRGFTSDVLILDEVSRFNEFILTSAKPTLASTGGQIWMCSTPKGKQGFFYESFINKNNRFKVFHVNTEEVYTNRPIMGDWTETRRAEALKFLEEEKRDMSALQYGQEYLGLFLDELRQYFSDELIAKCCYLVRPQPPVWKKDNYMGVDIARLGRDLCAYEILNLRPSGKVFHVESITKSKQLTTKTEQDIDDLAHAWNCGKVGIDAGSGSLGVGLYDRFLQNPKMRHRVIAMNNRAISIDKEGKKQQRIFKEDMYENLKNMMEKEEIYLLTDEEVRLSLKSVQWEIVERAGLSKVRIFGDDTHIVEGIVRAAWLCKKEKIKKFRISYM